MDVQTWEVKHINGVPLQSMKTNIIRHGIIVQNEINL